jgi:hypothetical protein
MACHPIIERYVADLSVGLAGPRRWRDGVLDEIRDSLLEGMDVHSDAGADQTTAASHAVAEHGPVDEITRAYATELAVVWVRRTGLLTLSIVPAMAILWNVALRVGPPQSWHPSSTVLHLAEPIIASGVCLTLLCSSGALLGTGRLTAIVSEHLLTLRFAVCAASMAVSLAVLALLSVVAVRAVTAPASLEWPGVLTALALSLIALTGVGNAARRCVTSLLAVAVPA